MREDVKAVNIGSSIKHLVVPTIILTGDRPSVLFTEKIFIRTQNPMFKQYAFYLEGTKEV